MKSQETAHGNHVELQAIAEMYNRPIEVYQYNTSTVVKTPPINTFFTNSSASTAPIRLSYHRSSHYNSVVDPYNATVGVGLGLPQFFPGLADRNLMSEATLVSEKDAIEQAMLKDKLQATDWEATDAQLQQQEYLDSLKKRKEKSEDEAGCSSSSRID
ncbi:OTU domain containing protein [Trichuris trichiura]|uniref:ubiquitinyl hydrolase 1 n=1 Tax=Trichuris trichiura TaxID=36087 RepID=A0A077YX50_TRITR|nr:OTU domain containing protein [Trichuris trichiura]